MYAIEIEKKITDRFIEIPAFDKFKSRNVKIIFMVASDDENKKEKYNFDDIIGKLKWKGNSVDVQRRLRDEW